MITRTTPLKRSALKRRPRKKRAGDDKAYMAWIRTLPCVCCYAGYWETVISCGDPEDWAWLGYLADKKVGPQLTPTEAAHIGERGLGQKCPDRETAPLCALHHREGTESHHKLQKRFWGHWRLNAGDLIAALQQRYDTAHPTPGGAR